MTTRLSKETTNDRHSKQCCHIGVDLTLMIQGGVNGGIKPAILTFLQTLSERFRDVVRFTLLVNSSTYQEAEFLVRDQDRMICIVLTHGCPWPTPDLSRPYLSVSPRFVPARLKDLGIDVFYCPFGPTNRSTPDVPTVSMITDLLHRDYPFSIPDSERVWREEYFRNILADADYVQCISQYTLDRLLDYYRINRGRVFFTHLPIDQRLRGGSELAHGRDYFIYPANFWIHKNHEVLLIAYRIYRETTRDPWDLVLTGDAGAREKEIRDLANVLQIEENVRFVGYVDEPAFAQLLEGAGALVYPSLHEGFGIPLIEAMRFRKPIICSQSASIPEVTGDAALCVDGKKPLELAAAMVRLTEDPALRDQLVLRGEERLQSFSLESEIDKLYKVFTTAMNLNSGKAKLFRRLRRFPKWGRLLVRIWKKATKPNIARAVFGECLRQARAGLEAAKVKLHCLGAKIASVSSWKL